MTRSASAISASDPPTAGMVAGTTLGVVAPLVAAFLQQQLAYSLVDPACTRNAAVLVHLPAVLGLGILALAAWFTRRARKRTVADGGAGSTPNGHGFWIGLMEMVDGLAFVLIVAQWLPLVFLHPCQR